MLNKELSQTIKDAALNKGYMGVMSLSKAIKESDGLGYERVTKVWAGNVNARIDDYITIMRFLNADISIKLMKGIKKWKQW